MPSCAPSSRRTRRWLPGFHADLESYADRSMKILIAVATIGISAVFIVAVVIARLGIARPLSRLTGVMERLAQNDLAIEVPALRGRDEIAQMAGAVLVFKDNAARVLSLQDEQASERDAARKEQADALKQLADTVEHEIGVAVKRLSAESDRVTHNVDELRSPAARASASAGSVSSAASKALSNAEAVTWARPNSSTRRSARSAAASAMRAARSAAPCRPAVAPSKRWRGWRAKSIGSATSRG